MRGVIAAIGLMLGACEAREAAEAPPPAPAFVMADAGVVTAVGDTGALTLRTAQGETLRVRPAAVRIPARDEPAGAAAIAALTALALDRPARLAHDAGPVTDRYGRALAQVFVETPEGEVWLQEALVRAGHARVYTDLDARRGAAALYAAEAEARAAGRGLWVDAAYAVRSADPNELALYLDSVQIVEGRVISAANVRGRVYLNFGFDYRTDFTISVAPAAARRFAAEGVDLLTLEDAQVRVRGWVYAENGPMISIDHPERLEIIAAD